MNHAPSARMRCGPGPKSLASRPRAVAPLAATSSAQRRFYARCCRWCSGVSSPRPRRVAGRRSQERPAGPGPSFSCRKRARASSLRSCQRRPCALSSRPLRHPARPTPSCCRPTGAWPGQWTRPTGCSYRTRCAAPLRGPGRPARLPSELAECCTAPEARRAAGAPPPPAPAGSPGAPQRAVCPCCAAVGTSSCSRPLPRAAGAPGSIPAPSSTRLPTPPRTTSFAAAAPARRARP
mmetsp:Transcript_38331/g.84241  ORF Transcript_38331/g.84241 Transcript_38331/m.84241 type:complete len:236 (-) Transcript_38331:4383-5090(-)